MRHHGASAPPSLRPLERSIGFAYGLDSNDNELIVSQCAYVSMMQRRQNILGLTGEPSQRRRLHRLVRTPRLAPEARFNGELPANRDSRPGDTGRKFCAILAHADDIDKHTVILYSFAAVRAGPLGPTRLSGRQQRGQPQPRGEPDGPRRRIEPSHEH